MAGNSNSDFPRWVIGLAIILSLVLFNKYLFTGARALLGVIAPVSTPRTSVPTEAPRENAAPTLAPQPTWEEAVEQVVTEAPAFGNETLIIWHNWPDAQLPAVRAVFDEYSRTHPGVTIELEWQSDLVTMLPTVIAAGQGPDILATWSGTIGQLAPDQLLPLEEQGISRNYLDSEILPGALETVFYDNHYWGIPIQQMGMALLLNPDLLGRGFGIPNDLAVFILLAKTYEQDHPGQKFFCNPGFNLRDVYFLAPILFQGGSLPGFTDSQGNVYLNRLEVIRATERMVELSRLTAEDSSYDGCQNAFMNGELPVWWTGAWAIPMLEDAGMEFEVAALGRPYLETYSLMLPRSVEYHNHTALALDVMQYFARPEIQAQIALQNRTIPASYYAVTRPEVMADKTLANFAWALNVSVPLFNTRFSEPERMTVNDALNNILNGVQSPEDALREAQQALEEQIANLR